jgi:S1-C subfamily serine protease
VVVLKVEPDGAADVAGLSKGDVIVGFGDAPIATKDEFRDAYIAACGRGAVALSVVPGGRSTASRLQLTLVL